MEVLAEAVTELLAPTLRAELRMRLLAESRQAVLAEVGNKLWDYAVQAPVKARGLPFFSFTVLRKYP